MKSPGVSSNQLPQWSRANNSFDCCKDGFQLDNVQTNLATTLSERLFHKSHQTFIKASHPGGQFNDEAQFDSFIG